jgi:hypothetical protein
MRARVGGTLRITLVLAPSFLSLFMVAQAQKSQGGVIGAIRGTWVIKSIYHTDNIEGPSPDEQKKLIGSEVEYGDRSLESCGQSVPITRVEEHRVDAAKFLADTRVRFSEVEINAPNVVEVVLNDRQAGSCFGAFPQPGQDVYFKSKDEILIDFEGVFYRAVRTR